MLLPSLPSRPASYMQFHFQAQCGMKGTQTLTFPARTHSSVSPRLLQRQSVAGRFVLVTAATVPMAKDVLVRAWVYVEPKSAESYSDVCLQPNSCAYVHATLQTFKLPASATMHQCWQPCLAGASTKFLNRLPPVLKVLTPGFPKKRNGAAWLLLRSLAA